MATKQLRRTTQADRITKSREAGFSDAQISSFLQEQQAQKQAIKQ